MSIPYILCRASVMVVFLFCFFLFRTMLLLPRHRDGTLGVSLRQCKQQNRGNFFPWKFVFKCVTYSSRTSDALNVVGCGIIFQKTEFSADALRAGPHFPGYASLRVRLDLYRRRLYPCGVVSRNTHACTLKPASLCISPAHSFCATPPRRPPL
jgi:hypothetical protein